VLGVNRSFHFAGARYCDGALRKSGFSGELVDSGAVLVVKTHYTGILKWTAMDQPVTTRMTPMIVSAIYKYIKNPLPINRPHQWQTVCFKDSLHVDNSSSNSNGALSYSQSNLCICVNDKSSPHFFYT